MKRRITSCLPRPQGFTLVEMMIALALGLIVVGAVLASVVANGTAFRSTQALSRLQESGRGAFEMLTRDLRSAGSTPCGRRQFDLIDDGKHLVGFGGSDPTAEAVVGSAVGQRVPGTAAVRTRSTVRPGAPIQDTEDTKITLYQGAPVSSSALASSFVGKAIVLCNTEGAVMTTVASSSANVLTVSDAVDAFQNNSIVSEYTGSLWFIGNNGRDKDSGKSLYRQRLGGALEEVVEGVVDMQLQYRVGDSDFAAAPADWNEVKAIKLDLVMQADPSSAQNRLTRNVVLVAGIRSRE